MRNRIAILALLLAVTASASAHAASLDDMSWIAGRWTGTGLGGRFEETWSPADAGAMLGTFRLIRDGKPAFYEFLILTVIDDRLVMRLKHFHPDLVAWEAPEKFIEFRYLGTKGNVVEFEGLRFVREGDDKVTIFLKMRGKDGTVREEKFEMTRIR